jgi:GNAT superfamily N-acetyltransferase
VTAAISTIDDYIVRPYDDADEGKVIELLDETLGAGPIGARTREFFRWKHVANPFGHSFMLVAESGQRIIGLRAFLRWSFQAGPRSLHAVQAVDTATHPDYQGRGVFRRLTLAALEQLRNEADFVFNTPNEKSLPGYLKMGWEVVGTIPVSVRLRRPVRFAKRVSSFRDMAGSRPVDVTVAAPSASDVIYGSSEVPDLLTEMNTGRDDRISTDRSMAYLGWRYCTAPGLDYWAVREPGKGRLRGFGVFRIRSRGSLVEASVTDLFVRPGDRRCARSLIRAIASAAPVDHLTCHFPTGTVAASAAVRSGFLPTRKGIRLAVNKLRPEILPDPALLASWALSLGDVEVF